MDFSKPEEFTYTNGKRIVKFFLDIKKVKLLELRWKKIKKVTPTGVKFSTNVLSYNKFSGFPIYQILNRDIVKNLLLFFLVGTLLLILFGISNEAQFIYFQF
jgi:hypothetical protein